MIFRVKPIFYISNSAYCISLCLQTGEHMSVMPRYTEPHRRTLYQNLSSAGGATVCGQHYLQHFTPGLFKQRRRPDCVISTSVVFYLLTGLLPSLLPATCAVQRRKHTRSTTHTSLKTGPDHSSNLAEDQWSKQNYL